MEVHASMEIGFFRFTLFSVVQYLPTLRFYSNKDFVYTFSNQNKKKDSKKKPLYFIGLFTKFNEKNVGL